MFQNLFVYLELKLIIWRFSQFSNAFKLIIHSHSISIDFYLKIPENPSLVMVPFRKSFEFCISNKQGSFPKFSETISIINFDEVLVLEIEMQPFNNFYWLPSTVLTFDTLFAGLIGSSANFAQARVFWINFNFDQW